MEISILEWANMTREDYALIIALRIMSGEIPTGIPTLDSE
jgi:hypothetical protein